MNNIELLFNKEIMFWDVISMLLFFFVLIIGENIVTVIFRLDYAVYLNMIFLISVPLVLLRIKKLLRVKAIYLFFFFVIFAFILNILVKHLGVASLRPLIAPFFLFFCIPNRKKNWVKISVILILFIILNSIIAIFERINMSSVVGFVDMSSGFVRDFRDDFGGKGAFRSVALLGHPLQNALITTIVMTFVLFSNLKNIFKFGIWSICFIGVVSFNARAALVVNVCLLLLYAINSTLEIHKSFLYRLSGIVIPLLLFFLGIYLFNNTTWADRIKEMGLYDSQGSADTRFLALEMFSYFDWDTLLFGVSGDIQESIMNKVGVRVIENYWVGMIIRFGLIVMIPFVVVSVILIWHYYKGYTKSVGIITIVTFLLLSSTNNSLIWTYVPTYVFLLCLFIFNPQNIRIIIPSRYLISKKRMFRRL